MLDIVVYAMVYLGAALMAYNVVCFTRLMMFIKKKQVQEESNTILYVPVVLLVLFLLGYLAVGIFGKPDLIVGGILFGGSIFVFVMYRLMNSITGRVIRSERIEAELMAAEESNRVKTSFLAGISHEMRTPMNVIIGLDGIALKNPRLEPETRDQLEKIGRSAHHLLGLINNILDMNRIESGEAVVKNESFSLRSMWERLDAMAETLCEQKGLEYHTSIEDEVAGWYVGDDMLLTQVVLVLLDNAVECTDAPGEVSLSIEKKGADGGRDIVQMRVTDTSDGIDADLVDKVFSGFEGEAGGPVNRYGGNRLDLAAAKDKVELLGGTIDVASKRGEGSTFTVTIPLAQAAVQPSFIEPKGSEEMSLEGRRILVVDDVEENAEIVADLLELEDAESECAENGKIALELFTKSEAGYYDAILMDLRMPIMDGLEAARSIRALDRPDAKTIPIVALTANAFESDVRETLESGMNVHLAKPVDADVLYSTLREQISAAQNERQGINDD